MRLEDLMPELAACWCQTLSGTIGGAPATCCLVSGKPAIPDCCAGYGWVRLVGAYPSVSFPAAETKPMNCLIDTWAIQVEVGVTRCAPQPCDVLGQPCCDSEADASAVMFDDIRAVRALFTCQCLPLSSKDIVFGSVKVYGPEGGCNGIVATATLRVTN